MFICLELQCDKVKRTYGGGKKDYAKHDAVPPLVTPPSLPSENSTGQKLCTALYQTVSSTYAIVSFSIHVPETWQKSDCHRENEFGKK